MKTVFLLFLGGVISHVGVRILEKRGLSRERSICLVVRIWIGFFGLLAGWGAWALGMNDNTAASIVLGIIGAGLILLMIATPDHICRKVFDNLPWV